MANDTDNYIEESRHDDDHAEISEQEENDLRECGICNQHVHITDYFIHMMTYHPMTLMVMTQLFSSSDADSLNEYIDNYHTHLLHATIDSVIDHLDYESLQNLCDAIGYHKIGISDITTVTTAVKKEEGEDDECPICMDKFLEKENIVKTNVCNHIFCKECLETWIVENKVCPVCKQELQIASISKSSSEDSEAGEDSSDSPASANTT